MKWLSATLLLLLLGLQYRLWVGEGSYAEVVQLKERIAVQRTENAKLKARNEVLRREVQALRSGTLLIEERARSELGMIKAGETFYLVVDEDKDKP